jgi:predicted lipid-binding transport protein (Tim44 family)
MTKRVVVAVRGARWCRNWRTLAVAVFCAWIALAPSLAEARAGAGSSMGSRGSRTYSGDGGQSMQRSMTPQTAPSQPQFAPRPSPFGTPGFGGGFMQQHPFMSGLAGGFLGAGLAGMFFGHSAWAGDGVSPFGSMLGLLLQFALIGGLIWLAVQFFRRRSSYGVGAGAANYPRSVGAMAAPAAPNPVEIPISDADFNAWTAILTGVQGTWSKGDLAQLRRYVTPEMLSYFSEELSRNASQGVENRIEQVTLLKGDLQEAWQEGGFEYATARLSWSAVDYMVPAASHAGGQEVIVSGDPSRPVQATELWTFMRSHGGNWLLSAIQQV